MKPATCFRRTRSVFFAPLRLCVKPLCHVAFSPCPPFVFGLFAAVVSGFLLVPAWALDYVTLRRDGKETQVSGRLVVTAQDGGLLLLARDGVLWAIPPEEQVETYHRRRALSAARPRRAGQASAGRVAAGVRGPRHDALPDLLQHVARHTPSGAARCSSGCTWRSPTTGRARGSSLPSRSFRWWPSCLPTGGRT